MGEAAAIYGGNGSDGPGTGEASHSGYFGQIGQLAKIGIFPK